MGACAPGGVWLGLRPLCGQPGECPRSGPWQQAGPQVRALIHTQARLAHQQVPFQPGWGVGLAVFAAEELGGLPSSSSTGPPGPPGRHRHRGTTEVTHGGRGGCGVESVGG